MNKYNKLFFSSWVFWSVFDGCNKKYDTGVYLILWICKIILLPHLGTFHYYYFFSTLLPHAFFFYDDRIFYLLLRVPKAPKVLIIF